VSGRRQIFTLLTHFFTLLPIRSVAWRANLASAFFTAGRRRDRDVHSPSPRPAGRRWREAPDEGPPKTRAITRRYKEALADYQQRFAPDPENSVLERELNNLQAMVHIE
jgi:hypothetical protein